MRALRKKADRIVAITHNLKHTVWSYLNDFFIEPFALQQVMEFWWRWRGLNSRHKDYDSSALPAELHRHNRVDCMTVLEVLVNSEILGREGVVLRLFVLFVQGLV
jgi:hypothetical protein